MKRNSTEYHLVKEAFDNPEKIDMSLDISKRPLAGLDIINFRSRHGLQTVDVIDALCIQNSAKYNVVVRSPFLSFSMELLIRLYDRYPQPAPWKNVEPNKAFDLFYGDIMEQFRGTEYEEDTRKNLYERFGAVFGRSIFTPRRWIEDNGKCRRGMKKTFAILSTLERPRQVLESIVRLMYQVRGFNFDELYPLPTLDNPPESRSKVLM